MPRQDKAKSPHRAITTTLCYLWTIRSVIFLLFLILGIVLSVFIDSVEFIKAPVSSMLAYFSLGVSVFAFSSVAWGAYKDSKERIAKRRQKDERKRMREMAKASE
jgi:hypothetical protein